LFDTILFMKTFKQTIFLFFILFIVGCGSSGGIDPHLSLEEQQEITNVNLVGKWKIRKSNIDFADKNGSVQNDCSIDAIEFFEDRSYILTVSTAESTDDIISKIYRGKYDLEFIVTNNEPSLNKIVLMDADYLSGTSFPTIGSVATIDEINLTNEEVSFRIELGQSTEDFCTTGIAISLEGDKEEKLAPDAAEDSNHIKIQNEWRLIEITASLEGASTVNETNQDICFIFEEEYYDRCYDFETNSFSEDCQQAVTTTLLISGYGTYLFTYFDALDNIVSTDNGDWIWRTDTTLPFASFMVMDAEDESFEDADTTINVISITETSMILEELQMDMDEDGNSINVRLRYTFHLASLPYQNASCEFNF